jgi:hypothetical protein
MSILLPPALTLIPSRRGALTSCAPARRRGCPLDIRDTSVSPPARGEGRSRASCAPRHSHVPVQQSEPSALRAITFTRELLA